MAMQVQNIRFGHRDWQAIRQAAKASGVSTAQFVRNWARTGALLENGEDLRQARRVAREFHELERQQP